MVKVFAVGNMLMKDDKIGILIGKEIEEELIKIGVLLYICETDIEYALSNIQEKDFVLIIDAMLTGEDAAEVKLIPIDSIDINAFTQHSLNLIQLINLYYKEITVFIIGIEAEDISYDLGISEKLSNSFDKICCKVKNIIKLFINSK
ncbi:MAG: hydrogenase maturation protease [Bacillota bacterium]|nr:hydrogenase maturation protease [Bacillota bacterium]